MADTSQPVDVAYLRVSSEEQRQRQTIGAQRGEVERWLVYTGTESVRWLADEGVSGILAFEDRPAGAELLGLLRGGRVRTLIVPSIDRLGRSALEILRVVETIKESGARLVSVREHIDLGTPVGHFFLTILAAFAQMEREWTRQRTVAGKLARVHAGKVHSHGSELFGYVRDKERGIRLIRQDEAGVVRDLYRWVGEEAASIRSVVRRLNETGVPVPSAGKRHFLNDRRAAWGTGVIHRILREPAYKGETIEWRSHRADDTGRRMQRPPSEQVRLPDGTTPAIVPSSLWAAVQRRLGAGPAAAARSRNADRPYLLRGLIVCAVCGRTMQPETEHAATRPRLVYRCRSRETPGRACGASRAPGLDCETWAWETARAVLLDPSTVAREAGNLNRPPPGATVEAERASLARTLAAVDRRQQRLARLYAATDDENEGTLQATLREMATADAERAHLRARIAELDRTAVAAQVTRAQAVSVEEYCARAAARITADTPFPRKRETMEALDVVVEADGRRWSLRGSVPLADGTTVPFERHHTP